MIDYHRQRLVYSANYFKWEECKSHPSLKNLESWEDYLFSSVKSWQDGNSILKETPLKLRVAMRPSSEHTNDTLFGTHELIRIEMSPVGMGQLDTFFPYLLNLRDGSEHEKTCYRVIVDYIPTNISHFTWLKTGKREHYNAARDRMAAILQTLRSQEKDADTTAVTRNCEVLLFNPNGEITEASIASVYFFRGGKLVTPPIGPEYGGLSGTARRWALERGLCGEQVVRREDVVEGEMVWLSNGVQGFVPGMIVWNRG